MATEKIERVKLITPEFRASYPTVFTPRKPKDKENDPKAKAKYSIAMYFRVQETPESKAAGEVVADLKELKAEVAKVFLAKLGPDWANIIQQKKGDGSPMYKVPFKNGAADDCKVADPKAPGGFKWKPGMGPGVVVVRASSEYKPGVVDRNKAEILNPQDFQGGDYARAQVHAYWYDVSGNKGVTFGLDNVQMIRNGERFGGAGSAEDAFDAMPLPTDGVVGAGVAPSVADPLAALG